MTLTVTSRARGVKQPLDQRAKQGRFTPMRDLLRPLACALVVAAGPALAEDCPPWSVDETLRAQMHEALRLATSETAAQPYSAALWDLWTTAPDAPAQELLDAGVARLRVGDFQSAEATFDRLVEYCPDYAEGYNQRAFSNYLRQNFEPALVDLDAALARNPTHVGALSGRALTLMEMGRDQEALTQLEAALDIHPWLSERGLLPVLKDRLGAQDI